MNRLDELQKLACARPFTPFRVVLTDGRVLDVFRPQQMMINPPHTELIYSDDFGSRSFERLSTKLVDHWEIATFVRAS